MGVRRPLRQTTDWKIRKRLQEHRDLFKKMKTYQPLSATVWKPGDAKMDEFSEKFQPSPSLFLEILQVLCFMMLIDQFWTHSVSIEV